MPRRIWNAIRVPLAYCVLTLLLTWPLARHLGTALPGLGDALQQTWILAWNAHALRTDPLAVWQAPIFYPYPDTAAYHDHLLIQSLVGAPIIWLTGNPILAHNLLLLLTFALTGWAVYGLAFDLTRQRWAAFIAGAAFAFCAYRMSHFVHLNLLQTAWLPWALLFLRRLLQPVAEGGGQLRDALLFGLFVGLQCANAIYYSFFALAVAGGYALIWGLAALWQRLRRKTPLPWATGAKLLLGGGLAALLTLPFMLPYIGLYRTLGIVRSVRELDNWSAPLIAYLAVTPHNLLVARLGEAFVGAGELTLFPGVLITLLGLLALWRRPGRDTLFWGLVAGAAFVLSLGTGLRLERGAEPLPVPLPYLTLYAHLPGFGAMRVPARWGMLVTLALALLAGLMLGGWLSRMRGRWRAALGGGVLALVLLEQLSIPQPIVNPSHIRPAPPVYAWLGAPEQRDIQVLMEFPVGRIPRGEELERITWRHFHSLAHWKRLPVAYGALIPFGTTELMARVQRFPDAETLIYLQLLGVDTLLLHRDEYAAPEVERIQTALAQSPLVQHRADVGAASVYTLRPATDLERFAATAAPGASIYIAADERMPGVLALALIRRWQEQFPLYGPGRTRFYAALASSRPGQVFDFGLLAAAADPADYGFAPAGLLWRSAGLALYAADPALRVSLSLGQPVPGQFHPAYPADLEVIVQPEHLRAGASESRWRGQLDRAWLELDIASLTTQSLRVGADEYALQPGLTTLVVPVALDQPARISGALAQTAIQRLRLRAAPPPPAEPAPALVAGATVRFEGTQLRVEAEAGGGAALLLDVRGAAAYDDRPIHLLAGAQPIAGPGGRVVFAVDLLAPSADWLNHQETPQDGRYIAYLKDAANPGGSGQPIAKFNIRNGALTEPEPVPLPLTIIR